jgi:flagellin
MSAINTNVQSMIAQRVLGNQNQQLNNTMQKLSTGLQINSGKDDPSGLIASENLRSQETAIDAALTNTERADSMMSVAEGGLKEVNAQLQELQSLVTESANESGLSDEEKAANQQEINAILDSIDRIADTTTFQGQKLLNGGMDFNVTNDSNAESVNVTETNGSVELDATVTDSAQKGSLFLSTGGDLNFGNNGGEFVLEVTGGEGSKQFSFSSGTSPSEMADAINSFTSETGVVASQETQDDAGLRLDSSEYGSDERVAVEVIDDASGNLTGTGDIHTYEDDNNNALGTNEGSIAPGTGTVDDTGDDVSATVNGQNVGSYGRQLDINLNNVKAEVLLSDDSSDNLNAVGGDTSNNRDLFDVDGGAKFSIGADVDQNSTIQTTLGNVTTPELGKTEVDVNGSTEQLGLNALGSEGHLNVEDANDMSKAQEVVEQAVKDVSDLRGRIGSIQKNTLEPTMNNLNVAKENTAAAESAIRDTDFAEATAEMTRSQILSQSARNTLGMANNQPQNVLSLLGG